MIEIDIKKELNTAHGKEELRVKIEIQNGDSVALFGKSGSGKTTLLRILAGLERPQSGKIVVDGVVWFDAKKKINLPPQKRGVGFVFQDYALFPHMSVYENLTFALSDKRELQRVDEILEIMEIQNLVNHKPSMLSGGQQQRVALARTLVNQPKILLLDEPLSALDTQMRHKLQSELLKVQSHFNLTTILVSHDIAEIIKLSKRLLELKNAQIVYDNTPLERFVKSKARGNFDALAEIVAMQKHGSETLLTLLFEGRLLELSYATQELGDLCIGSKLHLSATLTNLNLQRIDYDTSE